MTIQFRAPQLVFVYGSLKKGLGNAVLLANPKDALYCGTYTTRRRGYTMHSYGGFPAVVNAEGHTKGHHIIGEVYMVTTSMLKRLDTLEGAPDWYERKRVFLDDGSLAWMYILPSGDGLPVVEVDTENNSQTWIGPQLRKGIESVTQL